MSTVEEAPKKVFYKHSADRARQEGWQVGDVLRSKWSKVRATEKRITAIGEQIVLARTVRWTLDGTHWSEGSGREEDLVLTVGEWERVSNA